MTAEQLQASALILATLGLFAWGRLRYDLVAILALIVAVYLGLVPAGQAFGGFVHPAVITVIAVLVLSKALADSGIGAWLANRLVPRDGALWKQIGALCVVEALLSAVMNNVGALALLLPVAIVVARNAKRSPALFLMPLAFASLLGGLVTLIGTPPNLIVSNYRAQLLGEPYQLFDFAPVGGTLAVLGVAFIALIGWRLIPVRSAAEATPLTQLGAYISEGRVPRTSPAIGLTLREVEKRIVETEARVVALVRGERTFPATAWWVKVVPGDVLMLESAPRAIEPAQRRLQLEHIERSEPLAAGPLNVIEALIGPNSTLTGMMADQIQWRRSYGVNLLGVAHHGQVEQHPRHDLTLHVGDVLLLQGDDKRLASLLPSLGLLPLAERDLGLQQGRRPAVTLIAFGLALLASAIGLVPAQIALMSAVILVVAAGCLRLDEAYRAVDWPVVVLLGAMLPVGGTLESTGTTQLFAATMLSFREDLSLLLVLALLMGATMLLSNIVNNAATAVMMAPLAIDLAQGLSVDPDAFLMAVAVAASSAFMTPIGHQSNTLVMGPGGYRFWDYWPLGLPMQLLILAVSLVILPLFWQL